MGFFKTFWSKNGNGHTDTFNGNGTGANGAAYNDDNANKPKDIPEEVFTAKEAPKAEVVTNNIELLNKFLDRNYEEIGYNHALVNPDSIHLDQNVESLRNDLERTIRKVKTFYDDFIREIDFHIESRSRRGMVDTVEELKMKREIAESHVKQVLKIEDDAINKKGDSQGIVISYIRGFKNGLAAISHHNILNRKF